MPGGGGGAGWFYRRWTILASPSSAASAASAAPAAPSPSVVRFGRRRRRPVRNFDAQQRLLAAPAVRILDALPSLAVLPRLAAYVARLRGRKRHALDAEYLPISPCISPYLPRISIPRRGRTHSCAREDTHSAALGRIPRYSLCSRPSYSHSAPTTLHNTALPPRCWRAQLVGSTLSTLGPSASQTGSDRGAPDAPSAAQVVVSPRITPYLPISPHTSPHLVRRR